MESFETDSDLKRKFDEVSKTVKGVNDAVAAIAGRTGIPMKPGYNPTCPPGSAPAERLLNLAAQWAVAQETFSVERCEGVWNIVYSRIPTPAMALLGEKPVHQPITECSLDVKRGFLKYAIDFVKRYKDSVSDRLAELDTDIGRGKEAIDLLSK